MKKTLRIGALTLSLLLCLSILASCNPLRAGTYDYAAADLSPYLTLSAADLQGIAITVPQKAAVTDADTRAFLFQQSGVEEYLTSTTDTVMEKGDRLSFFYRVLYNGEDVPFLSNYADDTPATALLGEDTSFLAGTAGETLWNGVLAAAAKPESYGFEKRRTGTVANGEIAYVSYTAKYEKSGEIYDTGKGIRLDTARSDGEYSFLNSVVVGTEVGKSKNYRTYDGEKGDYVNYTVTVKFRLTAENPLAVNVVLPADYDKGGTLQYLGGKTVTFYIIPLAVERFDDSFLTDMKELLTEMANAEYEEAVYAALEEKLYLYADRITDYPEEAVRAAVDEIRGYIRLGYDDYKNQAGTKAKSFEEYESELFLQGGFLSADLAYQSYAEDAVAEYLVYYAAARTLGITLEEKKHNDLYDSYIASLIRDQGSTVTKEDVEKLYAGYYGESYLRWFVGYSVVKTDVLDAIRATAIITEEPAEE